MFGRPQTIIWLYTIINIKLEPSKHIILSECSNNVTKLLDGAFQFTFIVAQNGNISFGQHDDSIDVIKLSVLEAPVSVTILCKQWKCCFFYTSTTTFILFC